MKAVFLHRRGPVYVFAVRSRRGRGWSICECPVSKFWRVA